MIGTNRSLQVMVFVSSLLISSMAMAFATSLPSSSKSSDYDTPASYTSFSSGQGRSGRNFSGTGQFANGVSAPTSMGLRGSGPEHRDCSPSRRRTMSERQCMICNVYFESRGEPHRGQVEVARTVLTRMQHPNFPASACDVIYQVTTHRTTGRRTAQFSWTIDRNPNFMGNDRALRNAVAAVDEALARGPNGYENFHADYVNPRWYNCEPKDKFGRHIFYKCRYGGTQVASRPASQQQPGGPVRATATR